MQITKNILLSNPVMKRSTENLTLVQEKISVLPVLKLGDFGFARSLNFQSLASTLCGSPLYMAPEILKGEKYDAKSDLWSVGTIIYEMICGRAPYRAQNHIELLRKIELGWKFPEDTNYNDGKVGSLQQTQNPSRALNVGSLPSKFNRVVHVATDLKELVKGLLKKNPVERIGFEEFFISGTVVECRKLDQISWEMLQIKVEATVIPSDKPQSPGSPRIQKSIEIFSNSPAASEINQNQIDQIIEAPFPEYNHDVSWLKKIDEIQVPTGNRGSQQLSSSDKLSYHSSLASELDNLNSNQNDSSSDEFIVVEKQAAELNWHSNSNEKSGGDSPRELGTTPLQATFTQPKFVNDMLNTKRQGFSNSSLDRIPSTPKQRLLGSLRGESPPNYTTLSKVTTPEPTNFQLLDLLSTLPIHLNFSRMPLAEEQPLLELLLNTARVIAVYRMTTQYHKESRLDPQEIFQLYIHSLGCLQTQIETSSQFYKSCSNRQEVLKIVEFLQDKFEDSLQKAEQLSSTSGEARSGVRTPERIIYETAIATAKAGNMAEQLNKPYLELYRTAILLLQSLAFAGANWSLEQGEELVLKQVVSMLVTKINT